MHDVELKMLGTHPGHHRRGAASLELDWATEIADRAGLPCWVQASELSVGLYKKHGFVAVDEVVSVLSESGGARKYVSTSMIREPRTVAAG